MRKVIGWIMILLGTFLLVAVVLIRVYALDALKVTPLSVDQTTHLAGTADKLNPTTGKVENLDVKVRDVTKTDDAKSDGQVVVWVDATCVVVNLPGTPDCVDAKDPQERLITAQTDVFATDRKTAEAIPADQMSKYLPADAIPHEGLVNKWPFDAQKKAYPYWNGLLEKAVPAEYIGTETVDGMSAYVYQTKIDPTKAEVVTGIKGLYSAETTIKVDPITGAILYQRNHEIRTALNGDPLIDLDVAFTDDQVKDSVAQAKDGGSQLNLIGVVVPIAGGILGVLLIGGGLFLALRRRHDDDVPSEPTPEPQVDLSKT